MSDWKNDALRGMLYDHAARPSAFFETFPPTPLTRRERLWFRVTDLASRVRRAAAILAGREEE